MIVRVKLYGSGTPTDPYRANLPNYQTLAVDVPGGTITVLVGGPIPNQPLITLQGATVTMPTPFGAAITALQPVDVQAAQAVLDSSYPAPAGTYKLEPK